MLFEVKVGVNKDGYEVYRVEADNIAAVVAKAHAEDEAPTDDNGFEYVGDADVSCLTRNWSDVTASDVKPVEAAATNRVTIRYTNYRGETADRVIVPEPSTLRFGSTEHHREPQWLFDALDVEKNAVRTFAMKDVHFWRPG